MGLPLWARGAGGVAAPGPGLLLWEEVCPLRGPVGWSLTELHDSGIELGDLLSFCLPSPVSPRGTVCSAHKSFEIQTVPQSCQDLGKGSWSQKARPRTKENVPVPPDGATSSVLGPAGPPVTARSQRRSPQRAGRPQFEASTGSRQGRKQRPLPAPGFSPPLPSLCHEPSREAGGGGVSPAQLRVACLDCLSLKDVSGVP